VFVVRHFPVVLQRYLYRARREDGEFVPHYEPLYRQNRDDGTHSAFYRTARFYGEPILTTKGALIHVLDTDVVDGRSAWAHCDSVDSWHRALGLERVGSQQ
jgi:hypothetical protein